MYMQSWIRNERGDFGDMLNGMIVLLVILGFLGIMMKSFSDYNYQREHAPCSTFADRNTSSIPVRCLNYFIEATPSAEVAK